VVRGKFLLSSRTCGSKLRGSLTLLKNGGRRKLSRKLKVVKEELKKWNREVFGDIRLKKFNLLGSVRP